MTNSLENRNKKRVIVVGAGAAGMFAALTLSRQNCQVDLIDLQTQMDQKRKQRQHPHLLLSEGSEILRFMFESVWQELLQSSSRIVRIGDILSQTFPEYIPTEVDMKSHFLTFSRIELENVLLAEIKRNPKIQIHNTEISGFIKDSENKITGVVTESGVIQAALVVDATGRLSRSDEMLSCLGVEPPTAVTAGGTYVSISRLYKSATPGPQLQLFAESAFRGGIYPLRNNQFYVAFHLPQNSHLVPQLINSAGFHAFASDIEKLSPFMQDALAMGTLHVTGGIKNSLKKFSSLAGYLPIGDRICHTNPFYGHGITYILKQMQILTSALLAYSDFAETGAQWIGTERKIFASTEMSEYFLNNCYRELAPYWNLILMSEGRAWAGNSRFAVLSREYFNNKMLPMARTNPDHLRDFLRVFLIEKSPYQMILNPKLHFDIFKSEFKSYLSKNDTGV